LVASSEKIPPFRGGARTVVGARIRRRCACAICMSRLNAGCLSAGRSCALVICDVLDPRVKLEVAKWPMATTALRAAGRRFLRQALNAGEFDMRSQLVKSHRGVLMHRRNFRRRAEFSRRRADFLGIFLRQNTSSGSSAPRAVRTSSQKASRAPRPRRATRATAAIESAPRAHGGPVIKMSFWGWWLQFGLEFRFRFGGTAVIIAIAA